MAVRVVMLGPTDDCAGGITSVVRLIRRHQTTSVDYHYIASLVRNDRPAWYKASAFVAGWVKLCWILMTVRPALAHIHMSACGSCFRKTVYAATARCWGVPVLIHMHSSSFAGFYPRLPRVARAIIGAIMRRSAGVLALSAAWRRYYRVCWRLPPQRVTVMHNPTELPEQLPDRGGHTGLTVLFLGHLGERKGLQDLIVALARSERATITVIACGDGDRQRLEALAAKHGVSSQVEIRGWIGPAERDRLMASSDVLALPSYDEGLPMAILEAMAWGLPILATPVGGIPEVVRTNREGLLVEPGDIAGLTAALISLHDEVDARRRMAVAARRQAEQHDIRRYVRALGGLYADLARASR